MHKLHTFEYRLNRRGKGKIKKIGRKCATVAPYLATSRLRSSFAYLPSTTATSATNLLGTRQSGNCQISVDMWYRLGNNASMDQSITTAPLMKSTVESTPTLLVLGAGPKGVAIAAKRYMLAKLGYPVPHLRIIDQQGVAPHWSGQAGFTDGNQSLGTRPEKDVGFPYLSACWGDKALSRAVAKEMLHLSWQSYLINQMRYSDWIDRGRTRPTHAEWSKYIQWVAEQVGLDLCMATH